MYENMTYENILADMLSRSTNDCYYAPVSHMTNKQQTNMQIFENNIPISTIRFSFMIPAYNDVLIEKDFKEISKANKTYADLLNAEYKYCIKHEKEILDKANSVYKIGGNKNHKLYYTCCDFKLLESVFNSYINIDAAITKEQ